MNKEKNNFEVGVLYIVKRDIRWVSSPYASMKAGEYFIPLETLQYNVPWDANIGTLKALVKDKIVIFACSNPKSTFSFFHNIGKVT